MVLCRILSFTGILSFTKSARAVKVLKECIRLKPDDATIPLLAAKLCMGSLHWVSRGCGPCVSGWAPSMSATQR